MRHSAWPDCRTTTGRVDIVVDARGITDRSVGPGRFAWDAMEDVSLVNVDREMYEVLLKKLKEAEEWANRPQAL